MAAPEPGSEFSVDVGGREVLGVQLPEAGEANVPSTPHAPGCGARHRARAAATQAGVRSKCALCPAVGELPVRLASGSRERWALPAGGMGGRTQPHQTPGAPRDLQR